jgi:HlyD family secretion protein
VKTREAELLQRELEGIRKLWLIAIGPDEPREIMEPDLIRVQGEQGAVATIAKIQIPIGRSDMQAELGEDLKEVRAKIAEDQLAN